MPDGMVWHDLTRCGAVTTLRCYLGNALGCPSFQGLHCTNLPPVPTTHSPLLWHCGSSNMPFPVHCLSAAWRPPPHALAACLARRACSLSCSFSLTRAFSSS